MSFIEVKFINQLSNRLLNFKRKSPTLYNFKCPICGDSETHSNKSRGYFYQRSAQYFFHCHNCNKSSTFKNFLKGFDSSLYKQFLMESMEPNPRKISESKPTNIINDAVIKLPTIQSLPANNIAKAVCINRKIDAKHYSELFYAERFKSFVNELIPGKFRTLADNDPRLVLPFYDQDKKLIALSGRALPGFNPDPKYVTIKFHDENPKLFGLHRCNFNTKYIVVEGPIDSLFLENAIATADASLTKGITDLGLNLDNAVICYDNEPRNKAVVSQINKAILKNFSVVIWPSTLEFKDINDCILGGYSEHGIMQLIEENTFSGLTAQLRFAKWKQI